MADESYKQIITDVISANSNPNSHTDLNSNTLQIGDNSMTKNRTGTDAMSIFGVMLKIDISEYLAAITLKRVYTRGVIAELVWFLRGETDSKSLERMSCNIWRDNTSRMFLQSRGLHYEEGVAGPIYGYQWRSFGGNYPAMDGTDQIKYILDCLFQEPTSRRMILNSWNAAQIDDMALPPCHIMAQFHVREISDKNSFKLSVLVTQRSCDIFLGLPFNLLSYNLLVCLLAKLTGMVPDQMIFSIGDAHIYEPHIEGCREVLRRETRQYPTIGFSDRIIKCDNAEQALAIIDEITPDDFKIIGYDANPTIYGKMMI